MTSKLSLSSQSDAADRGRYGEYTPKILAFLQIFVKNRPDVCVREQVLGPAALHDVSTMTLGTDQWIMRGHTVDT